MSASFFVPQGPPGNKETSPRPCVIMHYEICNMWCTSPAFRFSHTIELGAMCDIFYFAKMSKIFCGCGFAQIQRLRTA